MCLLFREDNGQWVEEQKLEGHSDWVRDVAWAPSIGLPKSIIASCGTVGLSFMVMLHIPFSFHFSIHCFNCYIFCSMFVFPQDCRVIIWTNDGQSSTWTPKQLHKFSDVVWHVSWSVTGNILAVSGGDNKVRRLTN